MSIKRLFQGLGAKARIARAARKAGLAARAVKAKHDPETGIQPLPGIAGVDVLRQRGLKAREDRGIKIQGGR